MDHKFYDVKTKAFVTAKVLECVSYSKSGHNSYAFRGKTPDGRNLTSFVNKAVWEKAQK